MSWSTLLTDGLVVGDVDSVGDAEVEGDCDEQQLEPSSSFYKYYRAICYQYGVGLNYKREVLYHEVTPFQAASSAASSGYL
jgi:hypothetical protein